MKKKPLAVANIAPVGGDITIHLPLNEGRELYIRIGLHPTSGKGEDGTGDNLEVDGIMYRVDGEQYGNNQWVNADTTYADLLKGIERVAYKYLPGRSEAKDGVYHAGDKVEYSPDGGRTWHDAIVVQPNDEGGVRIDTGQAPVMYVNAHLDQLRHKAKETDDAARKAVDEAKAAMNAKLGQIKDKLDRDLLNGQIAQREKYMDELADRVKAGETIGTFAGTKNVDLQATLLRCIGELEALKEALTQFPAKPSGESIAENPQSWVGKTFKYGDTRLVCEEVDGQYAMFHNPDTYLDVSFEVDKVQKDLKSGKWSVEGTNTVSAPKDEDIFQKAERIAKEDKAKREKARAEAKVDGKNSAVPAKENKPAKKPAKEVKPEQPIGDLFAGLMDEEPEAKVEAKEDGNTEIRRTFANAVKNDMLASLDNGTKPYRGILDLRKRAKALGMDVDDEGRTDILLQELVEDGLVRAAREVIEKNKATGRYSK